MQFLFKGCLQGFCVFVFYFKEEICFGGVFEDGKVQKIIECLFCVCWKMYLYFFQSRYLYNRNDLKFNYKLFLVINYDLF